jgi:hypothetical protein
MHNLFPQERRDSPAGYLATQPGETLNGRWRIIRKLGWGLRSSTWLGVDTKDPDNISALKVFTIAATRDGTAETEREFLQNSVRIEDIQLIISCSGLFKRAKISCGCPSLREGRARYRQRWNDIPHCEITTSREWFQVRLEIASVGIHLNNFSYGGSESMTTFLATSLRG